jgi:diguanylate cyclase (GGDEF)-like protein
VPADLDAPARRAPSIRRRLLAFAALILTPVVAGALVSGGVLLRSASQSDRLGAEIVQESRASIALLRGLHAARLAGSGYMEEGEADELADFQRAAVDVAAATRASSVFDEPGERAALRGAQRDWQAAVDQLRHTQAGFGQGPAGEEDPEDVFEDHVNAALDRVERLVAHGQDEADGELVEAREAARWQALGALAALLVSLAIAVALAGRMAAALPRPLQQLTRAARALGAGDLDQRIPVPPSAELRELGETFNRMAAALREQHEQLERQAFTDPLTGVPNRALFERRARAALENRCGTVGVLMIDLDDFKLVNDGLGHQCGDQLIRLAAERISAAARPSDTVARLGGDEFAVLLEDLRGLDDALAAAERLRRRFDAPFDLDGSQVVVSASIGVALAQGALDPVELLRRADLAMYRVKERGKDGTMFFDPHMEDRAVGRLEAVNALRAALDRGELVAHFQPIVELAGGEVVSAEALLRWERPGHGLVPPLDFIPLAEETGLIQPIGAWILEEACTQARRWRDDGHARVRVSVNVSARQLLDPEFERMVSQTLRRTGLEPDALVLEVTESSVMQNAELTIPKLERVAATGVRLSLDDFGEGYSSLSHIRRLPIQGLKIARPFVRELGERGGDPRLVHGIIELARRLDLTLVAEGIELRAQEEALRAFGCRLGQGFLFSRPVPAPAFRALLADPLRDRVT